MNAEKAIVFPVAVMLLLIMSTGASALTVTVSQSGADSDEVMKDRTFTVEATDWSGDCTQASIVFTGYCSSCGLSGEETQKTIGSGETSVTWTTVSASQLDSAQKILVTVSGGCNSETGGEDYSFDIVLPPSLNLDASTSASSVAKGGGFTVNVDVSNDGETTANDITFGIDDSDFTLDCDSISGIDEGNSAGRSCTITAAGNMQGGSRTLTLTASSSNADDAEDTVPISVTYSCGDGECDAGETKSSCAADCGGGGGSSGGGFGGGLPPGQNRTRVHELVPGVGLRNNTKLLAAIEKVLAKGRLSDVAKENLLRLSASITSDFSSMKMFNSSSSKSRITSRLLYNGRQKIKNMIIYESVPKTFAGNASLVSVSAPGAGDIEVAENDPSWVIIFPEVIPSQIITVTYEVSGMKNSNVIDDMATELYAESAETLAQEPAEGGACTPASKRCSGSSLQVCSSDGTVWLTTEACTYGCDPSRLACRTSPVAGPASSGFPKLDMNTMLMIAAIVVIVAVIAVSAAYLKKRGGRKAPSVSAIEGVKQDLGK